MYSDVYVPLQYQSSFTALKIPGALPVHPSPIPWQLLTGVCPATSGPDPRVHPPGAV